MIAGLEKVVSRRGEAFDESFLQVFAGHLGLWIVGWQMIESDTLAAVLAMTELDWNSRDGERRVMAFLKEGGVHCSGYRVQGRGFRVHQLHFAVRRVEPSELRNPFEALDEELGKMVLP